MSKSIENLTTGEVLTVELELGEDLWLRNQFGEIENAQRNHFPLERWRFVGTHSCIDDVPVRVLNLPYSQRAHYLPATNVELRFHA